MTSKEAEKLKKSTEDKKPETPKLPKTSNEKSNDSDSELAKKKEETLYEALNAIGIGNVTTLVNRLGLQPKSMESPQNGKNGAVPEHSEAMKLIRLMGMDEKEEYASLLEKIAIQGRYMLGEVSKPTITSAAK
jgi:hypothetical protein